MKIKMQEIVDRLSEECHEAHRGAFWWDEGRRVAVAFGNDGYRADRRSQLEVEGLRRLLAEYRGRELGFAVSHPSDPDGGYSWALACQLPAELDPDLLEGLLWVIWNDLSAQREAARELELDEDATARLYKLNWGAVAAALEAGQFDSPSSAFTAIQANIARSALERNGLC